MFPRRQSEAINLPPAGKLSIKLARLFPFDWRITIDPFERFFQSRGMEVNEKTRARRGSEIRNYIFQVYERSRFSRLFTVEERLRRDEGGREELGASDTYSALESRSRGRAAIPSGNFQ